MRVLLGTFCLCALIFGTFAEDEREAKRILFPHVFQVVRFKNYACTADNMEGTCFTASECEEKNGKNAGACAEGYGVCCVFERTCGMTTNENCTVFSSAGLNGGRETNCFNRGNGVYSCDLEVCPCDDNICQLRLDFDSFTITGPSTNSESQFLVYGGNQVGGNNEDAVGANSAGTCATDMFFVNTPGGVTVPPICGENSGEHMYIDAADAGTCNTLGFSLGTEAVGTDMVANREWRIKVTQFACNSPNLAPDGCLQYLTGDHGTVSSYNYEGGFHLARQEQNICVRREGNNCKICWYNDGDDFALSGNQADFVRNNNACCAYGQNGDAFNPGFDCLIIPDARNEDGDLLERHRFCGNGVGLITSITQGGVDNTEATVCSSSLPFSIRFISDNWEYEAESLASVNVGFRLHYQQSNEDC